MSERPARPKVLLIGDGPTALSALRSLMRTCEVIGVLRAAADPAEDPVRQEAAGAKVEVWDATRLSDVTQTIERLRPEAVAISSYSRILPARTLSLARFVNVHYSRLPQYRGRANVNWAIINGEASAGLSIHLVTPQLDDGALLFQAELEIGARETAQTLYARLNEILERELGPAVLRAAQGDPGVAQNAELASYGCARTPDDGEIDWRQSTAAIDRLIRALSAPFPGAFTYLGRERLVIARAAPREAAPFVGRVAGRVAGLSQAEGWVDILTGDGVLRVFEVVDAAGETKPAAEAIGSTRSTLGLSKLGLLRRIESLEARLALLEARLAAEADAPVRRT
jgi:methionyl-tRNA formyltransferase